MWGCMYWILSSFIHKKRTVLIFKVYYTLQFSPMLHGPVVKNLPRLQVKTSRLVDMWALFARSDLTDKKWRQLSCSSMVENNHTSCFHVLDFLWETNFSVPGENTAKIYFAQNYACALELSSDSRSWYRHNCNHECQWFAILTLDDGVH
jgi:hypothetical protein